MVLVTIYLLYEKEYRGVKKIFFAVRSFISTSCIKYVKVEKYKLYKMINKYYL